MFNCKFRYVKNCTHLYSWFSVCKNLQWLFCLLVIAGGVLSPESHDLSHDEGFDSEDDSDHYEDFSSDAGLFIRNITAVVPTVEVLPVPLFLFFILCDQFCNMFFELVPSYGAPCWSQWPRGLRRRSAAARPLSLWVRIPLGGMDVCLVGMLCVVR